MTDSWDGKNADHKRIAHGIEVGDGIPEMRSIAAARNALKAVGFEIEHEEDLADRGDKIPWYYPLEGDLRKCQTAWDLFMCWRMTWVGKVTTQTTVRVLERFGLVPKGTHDVGESLKIAADNLVEGGRTKLFTPMMVSATPACALRLPAERRAPLAALCVSQARAVDCPTRPVPLCGNDNPVHARTHVALRRDACRATLRATVTLMLFYSPPPYLFPCET